MAKRKRLIVFGGSFDPPHRAHVELPMLVREKLGADAVIYVPAGVPPHKAGVALSDDHHRLAMLKLALADQPHAVIDTVELDRAKSGEPTYTVDTLEALRNKYPDAELRLLIGADQMAVFDEWKDPQRIMELAEPAVMARGEVELPDESWAERVLETPVIPISATHLRQMVKQGEPITGLVHGEVERYIQKHRLYQ